MLKKSKVLVIAESTARASLAMAASLGSAPCTMRLTLAIGSRSASPISSVFCCPCPSRALPVGACLVLNQVNPHDPSLDGCRQAVRRTTTLTRRVLEDSRRAPRWTGGVPQPHRTDNLHDIVFWRIRRCGPGHVLAVAGSVIALVSLAAQANRLASAGEVFGGRGRRQRKNVSLRRLYYATGACHCHQAWWPLSSLLPLPVKVLPTSGRWARDSLSGRALSQQPVQAA